MLLQDFQRRSSWLTFCLATQVDSDCKKSDMRCKIVMCPVWGSSDFNAAPLKLSSMGSGSRSEELTCLWACSRQLSEDFTLAGHVAMLFSLPEDLQFKIISELDCKHCAQLVLLSKEFQKLVQRSWSTFDITCGIRCKLGAIDYLGNYCSQVLRCLKFQDDRFKSESVVFLNTGELEM